MTSEEWQTHSKDWQDGWRAYQAGDDIDMTHEEYLAKSDEWKAGARYAAENPVGIMEYPQ